MVFRASWFEVQIWVDFGSDSAGSGTAKTRVSRERGCLFHIFTDPGIWSLLGSILDIILGPKLGRNDQVETLGWYLKAQKANFGVLENQSKIK